MSSQDPLIDVLRTQVQGAGVRGASYQPRRANIEWVKRLNREGLEFGSVEKRVLMLETSVGEQLFIQYPGKESARSGGRRPWDFRPKLIRRDGSEGTDLTFQMVWDSLFKLAESLDERKWALHLLAITFYRMAFMSDHGPADTGEGLRTFYVSANIDDRTMNSDAEIVAADGLFFYRPPREAIERLSQVITECCDMSLEAFLHYNDLLAWNEDCKYYHREVEEKGRKWIDSIGRPNNLLTHLSVLGLILGHVSFSSILGKASQQRGVAPASTNDLLSICVPFLFKKGTSVDVHATSQLRLM